MMKANFFVQAFFFFSCLFSLLNCQDSNLPNRFAPIVSDAKCVENNCELTRKSDLKCNYYQNQQQELVNYFDEEFRKHLMNQKFSTQLNSTAIQAILREFMRLELELYQVNPYYERHEDQPDAYPKSARMLSQSKLLPNTDNRRLNQQQQPQQFVEFDSLENKFQMLEQSDINRRSIRLLASQMDQRDIYLCCINFKMVKVDPFEVNHEVFLNISKQIFYSHETCAKISFENNYFISDKIQNDDENEEKEAEVASTKEEIMDEADKKLSERMIEILNKLKAPENNDDNLLIIKRSQQEDADEENGRVDDDQKWTTRRLLDKLIKLKQTRPADYYLPVMILAVTVIVSVLTGLAILMVFMEFLCSCNRRVNGGGIHKKRRKRRSGDGLVREDSSQFDNVNDYYYGNNSHNNSHDDSTLSSSSPSYTIGDYLRHIESTTSPVSTITVVQSDHLGDEDKDLVIKSQRPPTYSEVFNCLENVDCDDKLKKLNFYQPSKYI